jgi:hypothetical protein
MQPRIQLFVCALLCAAALSLSLLAQSKETATLPDTPVGRTLGAFLKAFNSGDLETMKRFHRERGGDEENADKDMNFYKQSGGLSLHSVKRTSEHELEVLLQAKQDGQWLSFTMSVDAAAPHAITQIKVQPADAP